MLGILLTGERKKWDNKDKWWNNNRNRERWKNNRNYREDRYQIKSIIQGPFKYLKRKSAKMFLLANNKPEQNYPKFMHKLYMDSISSSVWKPSLAHLAICHVIFSYTCPSICPSQMFVRTNTLKLKIFHKIGGRSREMFFCRKQPFEFSFLSFLKFIILFMSALWQYYQYSNKLVFYRKFIGKSIFSRRRCDSNKNYINSVNNKRPWRGYNRNRWPTCR